MPDGQNTFGNRYDNFDFSVSIIERDCIAHGQYRKWGMSDNQCSPEIICGRKSSDTIEQQLIFSPEMKIIQVNFKNRN